MTPIGVIGLGLVGSALAERLLGAGHRVMGWDLDPGRTAALRERGGDVAKDAEQVFSGCRRVLLSLPSHREVSDVVQGAGAFLTRGLTIIDTTTGDPASTEELARDLGARGIIWLDATISGSSAQVRAGSVTLMVGGDAESFDSVFGHLRGHRAADLSHRTCRHGREDEARDQPGARSESGGIGRRSGLCRVVGARSGGVARGHARQRRLLENHGHQGRAHDSW